MKFWKRINISVLRSRVEYDKDTGAFTWKRCRRATPEWNDENAGKRADILTEFGYRAIPVNGRLVPAHHAAIAYVDGVWVDGIVDHKNRKRGDNSYGNLRAATPQQNSANQTVRRNTKSGIKGVTPSRGKWMAHITVDGRFKFLGYHEDINDAARAHLEASKKYFGDFATDGRAVA